MPEQQMTPEQQEELRKKLENMSPEELREFQKKQCIFCHIVSGKVAAKKVYEDSKAIAILDINPANPGHILLMPKEHYMIMPQLPEDELQHIFILAKKLSNVLLRTLEVRGTNIIAANGPSAGQRAQHFMLHIIPRREGDGVEFAIPSKSYSEEELDKVAEIVRKKLNEMMGVKEEEKTAEDILNESKRKKVVDAEFREDKDKADDIERKPEKEGDEEDEDKKDIDEKPDEDETGQEKDEEKKDAGKETEEGDKEDDESEDDIDLDSIARVLNGG